MIRIRIVQCLCGPARHAILALAVNDTTMSDTLATESLHAAVDLLIEGRGDELPGSPAARLNPWCGICGAPMRDWRYEIGWSVPYENWEAAQRALQQNKADQDATKFLLDLLDQSFDARVRNPGGPIN